MLKIHTDKGTIEHVRGEKTSLPLTLNVAFKETKQVHCFLDPYHPWISEQDVRDKVQDPRNGYWRADALGVTGFEVSSRDGKETTGLVPVNAPLAAVVRKLTTKDGHDFFRVRLVATTRSTFAANPAQKETRSLIENIPERFKTFPKARWYRDMLSKTRDALLPEQDQ